MGLERPEALTPFGGICSVGTRAGAGIYHYVNDSIILEATGREALREPGCFKVADMKISSAFNLNHSYIPILTMI